MMSTRSLCLLFLLAAPLLAAAQGLHPRVVGAAGEYFTAAGTGSLHFTVGEPAVARTVNGMALERGFLPGLAGSLSTAVWQLPAVELSLQAYPNPSPGNVEIRGRWDRGDRLRLTNLLGHRLSERELPPGSVTLALNDYPAGIYLLTVLRDGRPIGGVRLLRQP